MLAGTTVPVSVVLGRLAAETEDESIAEYPAATEVANRAAAYGAVLAREELLPLPHAR